MILPRPLSPRVAGRGESSAGGRNSKYSSGERTHSIQHDSARPATGTSVSRIRGMLRARNCDIARITAQVQHIFRVSGTNRRLVRRAFKRHGGKPVLVGSKVRTRPAIGIEARVKLLLKTAQVPTLVMAGFPGAGEECLPGFVRYDGLLLAVGGFNFQPEDESALSDAARCRLPGRKKALARRGVLAPACRSSVKSTGSTSSQRGSHGAGPHCTRWPLTSSR